MARPALEYMPCPHAAKSGRFRVHKPKLVEWRECDDFDMSI
jgi:hypothetical protein